jgi:hypothetical protein
MGVRTWLSVMGGVVLGVASAAPAAQRGALPPALERAAAASATALVAEQIQLVRVLTASGLDRDTLAQIHRVVDDGYRQLDAGDAHAAAELAATRSLLDAARGQLLDGRFLDTPTREESQAAGVARRLESQRDAFLRELAQRLRQLLAALPPEQRAAAMNGGTLLVRAERADQLARDLARAAAELQQSGGSTRTSRAFDQLRRAAPADYRRERMRFALRSANIRNWERIPGLGRDGGRGDRGGNRPAPSLNDPALQARIAPYLQQADRLRAISPAEYDRARVQLALQMERERGQRRLEEPVSERDALDRLARPAGRAALQARAAGLPGAG